MKQKADATGEALLKREAELKEIEERIRVLIDHAPDAITVFDAKTGRFVDVNSRAMDLLEASREDLLQLGPADVSPPLQRNGRPSSEMARKYVEEALAGGTPVFEWTHRSLSGKDIDCEVRLVRLPSAKQALVRGSILDISERKRAETALQETSKRLKEAQRIAQMGSWEVDIPTGKVVWSDEVYKIFEQDPTHFKPSYESYFSFLHPDDTEYVQKVYANSLKTLKPIQFAHRLLLPGGRVKWISAHSEIEVDEDGEPRVARGTIQDITELKRAENALQETSMRLKDAQRIAKIGSWELDIPSGKVIWSDELYEILELDPKDVKPSFQNYYAFLHPDDVTRVREAYANSLKTKQPYQMLRRLLLPGDRVKWVSTHCETVFDKNGEPLVSRGTLQDITEQKVTEEALHETEATLAALLKIAPEAVILSDENLRITEFSGGAERMFGYERSNILGQPIYDLFPERLRADLRQKVEAFRASPELSVVLDREGQLTGLRKDGIEFPEDASLTKLDMPHGLSFAFIMRDFSERAAAQEALINAMREAQAASEAKSRFIANMSHELRTPLNAIIGFAELLADQQETNLDAGKRTEYAIDIRESGHHLLDIINDILEISRLELGSKQLNEAEIDLGEVIDDSLRVITLRATEGDVKLQVAPTASLPNIYADHRLMTQALINLLSNAVKFTNPGGEVFVGAEQLEDGRMSLYVRDTGIGMKAEDIERIGEPFMQADASLARRFEGTGLGLTITQRLAQLHGGELSVTSKLGEGTMARINLPAERVHSVLVPK